MERVLTVNTISRRTFNRSILTALLAIAWSTSPNLRGAHIAMAFTPQDSDVTLEQWMSEWMSVAKPVSGALHISRFKDPIYFLTKPITWTPPPEQASLPRVDVPKGFVTDLASIPRVFWSLLRPDGEYTYPAIIHDYLYWTQNISREKADLVFRLAMEDFSINPVTALTIYNAVRLGGDSAWQSNADQKARGQKRILKRFPEDPRVTWAEWKQEPDVFVVEMQ
jgi:hypothetical protein